jgi:hypothetical protein
MNARVTPYGELLAASYDHAGLTLDLYGTRTGIKCDVQHVCIPGTVITLTECATAELLAKMGAALGPYPGQKWRTEQGHIVHVMHGPPSINVPYPIAVIYVADKSKGMTFSLTGEPSRGDDRLVERLS